MELYCHRGWMLTTIRNHGKYLPCEEAYFGRAMCDYNRNKWSSAIEGFAQVISIDECPKELREQSRSLKANAEERREARSQRTANFFSGLFQVAAEVGTAYMAASQANAVQGSYNYPSMAQGKSLGTMSNAEFTNYVNTSPYQLANYSMMQVEQQWKQEEIQVKTGFASTYRQLHGAKNLLRKKYRLHMIIAYRPRSTLPRLSNRQVVECTTDNWE